MFLNEILYYYNFLIIDLIILYIFKYDIVKSSRFFYLYIFIEINIVWSYLWRDYDTLNHVLFNHILFLKYNHNPIIEDLRIKFILGLEKPKIL